MLASQQFCVKWNSYSSNLQNVFPRLLTSEHFVDITLACEGQMIKCHKVVLSACSTYFEKLLVQNPCQHPIIFMKDMKHWEVQALVDFMYKGEVNVSQDELNSLLVAAEALQIRGLCGSDHVNRPDGNRPSSSSGVSKIPLPHDMVLSGSTAVGRDSPPSCKRRRPPNEEKDQFQPALPRISNVTSASVNSKGGSITDVNPLPTSQMPIVDQIKTDGPEDDMDQDIPEKRTIKQEVDMEDSYLEGDMDADGPDEDYGSLEHRDDSDSNNCEDTHPGSPLDQPGPSGMVPPTSAPVEKGATDDIQAELLRLIREGWLPEAMRSRMPRSYSSASLWQALLDVKEGESIYMAAKHNGVPRKTLRNWMKRWNIKTPFATWLPKVRPYRQYSNDNLWAALMDVKQGGSVYRASKQHGIPRKTLRNWMKRWNIKSAYSPPVRKQLPADFKTPVSSDISKGSGVTLTPVVPKLARKPSESSVKTLGYSILPGGSGITIAPAVPAVLAAPVKRTRKNTKVLSTCDLGLDSGVTIAPAMPAVQVKPRY